MFINFAAVIASLGRDAAFRIANGARVAGDYLFNSILPERNQTSYNVRSGNMTIRATMAGMVGTDSVYPPGGMVDSSSFSEQTAKIANDIMLTEETQRQMQEFVREIIDAGGNTNDFARQQVLNFLDKVVIQPHLDTAEWLRGQALTFGAINWTFNKKTLAVNYGIPSGNFLPTRTLTAHTAYGDTGSMFWQDIRSIRRLLRTSGVRVILAHPDTIDEARYNTANNMVVVGEGNGTVTFRRVVPSTGQFTADASDTVVLTGYDLEAEVLNPANPSTTIKVPFMTRGKLVGIGNNRFNGFRVGMGATDNPNAQNELGYTHIGPTIEGNGRAGRWARVFVPEPFPWQLNGQAVTNLMPVLEAPEKVVVATTEMMP